MHDIRNQMGTGPNGICSTNTTSGIGGNDWCFLDYGVDGSANISGTFATTKIGGDQPHSNMPPYITVHIWKRVK